MNIIEQKIEHFRQTEGDGGRTDGDYTEGVSRYYFGPHLLLESYFTSCEIVEYCPICGTYGNRNSYGCRCHEYKATDFWYAFRDLLYALAHIDDEGEASIHYKRQVRDTFNKRVLAEKEVDAVNALLKMLSV